VRQLDCVTVKGSNQPVGLFTYDLDTHAAAAVADAMLSGRSWRPGGADPRRRTRAGGPPGGHPSSVRGAEAAAPAPPLPDAEPQAKLPPLRRSVVARAVQLASFLAGGSSAPPLAAPPAGDAAVSAGSCREEAAPRSRDGLHSSGAAGSGGGGGGGGGAASSSGAAGGGDAAELLIAPSPQEDDWADNPLVTETWGLDWGFKRSWDDAVTVGGCVRHRRVWNSSRRGSASAMPVCTRGWSPLMYVRVPAPPSPLLCLVKS
jgi:hypothetical protein